MTLDKNKTRLQDLDNEIRKMEAKEEDFIRLKSRFEHSLEEFKMNFEYLSRQNRDLLENTVRAGSKRAVNELEKLHSLTLKVDRYVDMQLEELSNTDKAFRKSLADEHEKLIKERNNLLWE